jgi:tetratricopeptide (TPR) repeat protein
MKNIFSFHLCRFKSALFLFTIMILSLRIALGQSEEIKKSKYLMEVDQTGKAIALLNQAIQTYPSVSVLYYYLGIAQIENAQRNLAEVSFEKGIFLDDQEPLNYVGRGCLSILEDDVQKAQMDFDKALAITKSKNVVVLNAVGEAYLGDSRLAEKAIAPLTKAKSIDDNNPETFILLGDAYLAQNSGGLAVTSYERASALDTKNAEPYYKIGLVYLRSRNFTGAQEAFNTATKIDPGYTLAYKELGELYYQMKEGPNAVKAYQTYLSLTDKPESGKLRFAFFLVMTKDFSKANRFFQELAQKEDVSPTTLRFYALSLYEEGNYERSKQVFEQYFAKASVETDANDYATYAKLLLKQNEDSLAILQLQKSLTLTADQPAIIRTLAETYYKTKKYEEAIDTYAKLKLLMSKLSSQDVYTLGRAYYFNNQYGHADSTFQQLIAMQPKMTVGYLWEARTMSNLDPESEDGLAQPFYTKLIEMAEVEPEKNKSDLVEAYSYLGYYHLLKQELIVSKSYWKKVLELNPDDARAKEALKAIN